LERKADSPVVENIENRSKGIESLERGRVFAKQMLSQLSYTPNAIFNFEACEAVGQGRGPEVIRGCLRATLCGGTSTKPEVYPSESIQSGLV
jgi:hypothetical protein